MTYLNFRSPQPTGATTSLRWKIVNPLWKALKTPYRPDPRLAALTPGRRALYAIHRTTSEVMNGGLDQYFSNSTGYLTPEFIAGARLVGAHRHASLMEEAVSLLGNPGMIRERDSRKAALTAMTPDQQWGMDQLTNEFFALGMPDSPELILDLAEKYAHEHADEFFI